MFDGPVTKPTQQLMARGSGIHGRTGGPQYLKAPMWRSMRPEWRARAPGVARHTEEIEGPAGIGYLNGL